MANCFYKGIDYVEGSVDGSWIVTEKLDGTRALWDGGYSVGKGVGEVGWCDSDIEGVCTGFWSRYWKPILSVPDRIIEAMPRGVLLDGEFWGGRGTFEESRSVIARTVNFVEWPDTLDFVVLDMVSATVFQDGMKWRRPGGLGVFEMQGWDVVGLSVATRFEDRIRWLEDHGLWSLDLGVDYSSVVEGGGEGVMYRKANSWWQPKPCKCMMKRKVVLDCEATVSGWTEGKGRLAGLIGALKCLTSDGAEVKVSGMSDILRVPGLIRVGAEVTIEYNELTKYGVPRNPRLKCVRKY